VQGAISVRWRLAAIGFSSFFAVAIPALPQLQNTQTGTPASKDSKRDGAILDEVRFVGLRRISPSAVAAQLATQPGGQIEPATIERDVRALARLGWFDSIQVEQASIPSSTSPASDEREHVALIFHLKEQPFLTSIEYSGSRLLSSRQIQKLLEEQKIAPVMGRPMDPVALHRIATAIRSSLHQLGHPKPEVHILSLASQDASLSIRFVIDDGPYLPVRQVCFVFAPRVPEKLLRAKMQRIAPWKPFASLQGKNAYSREAFEADRQRILKFYVDHGYPEARVGEAQLSEFTGRTWKLFPLPHDATQSGLLLFIPVEAGPFYRLGAVEPSGALQHALEIQRGNPLPIPPVEPGRAFSQQEVDKLRRYYSAHLQTGNSHSDSTPYRSVEAVPVFDRENHSVRLHLALSDSPPYLVRRLEFQGLHKFSDRYVRRRIPLHEGRPIDERALEASLTKLARTGYFKPIRKEDIHIQLDEARRSADICILLEEIGQQRATFSGGRAQFGSTLGLAYTVFDLFHREELLSAKFDGGPESLQVALGLAKEGIFGTRGSLALSVFNTVLRPRFTHGLQGPFFTSRSEGIIVPWTYELTNTDSFGVNYTLSRTTTDDPLGTPPGLPGLPPIDIRTRISSSAIGTAWAHDIGKERFLFSDSASGGFLGGDEHMLRASAEAARIVRDPLLSPSHAWAFRTTFSAAGSYQGNMPPSSRFFSGDEFVRGLRPGELGPIARTQTSASSAATAPAAFQAGANLITAANAEYRVPLRGGAEAAGFFDLGSGWLLPNWLGPARPNLFSATKGVLHGSTGIELRWTIPGIQLPLRSYYALNLLRLNRRIALSNKSILFAHNRFSAFGWGLGSLF
jgi:outer membrane protein assembly factor BamA